MVEISPEKSKVIRSSWHDQGSHTDFLTHDQHRRNFNWLTARQKLLGMSQERGLNMAYECVDRFVECGGGTKTAIRYCSANAKAEDITYLQLCRQSNAFANVLLSLGLSAGETVFTLLGRVPDLFVVCLGTLKGRHVFCPLFSVFGPEPILMRLKLGDARVLVTTAKLYEKKILPIRSSLPGLKYILITDFESASGSLDGVMDLHQLLSEASTDFVIPKTDAEDPAVIHFTSGTTGTPKGALHVHEAIVCHKWTAIYVFDLKPNDVFWCTADPGWVTGTSYGIFGPLANDVTLVIDEAEFDAERWYRLIDQENVSVLYTAPTAIRMLMRAGDDLPKRYDLSSLRLIASVGEPLNPEAVLWGARVLGLPIHDNWWQTETGGIMIANNPRMDIKPGSMGRPIPGIDAAIVRRNNGGLDLVTTPDVDGELAIKAPWPSMFRSYLGQAERYRKCFRDSWYLTRDLARCDADGYFWFIGRADDVIKSAGHLIGPFEVESVLMEHQAVAEAAVIGMPDPIIGESVKAYVSLKKGFEQTEDLKKEIIAHSRIRLGPALAPRDIVFCSNIPKTRSGKIMRRLLKARELGLPEGDISTLETDASMKIHGAT